MTSYSDHTHRPVRVLYNNCTKSVDGTLHCLQRWAIVAVDWGAVAADCAIAVAVSTAALATEYWVGG